MRLQTRATIGLISILLPLEILGIPALMAPSPMVGQQQSVAIAATKKRPPRRNSGIRRNGICDSQPQPRQKEATKTGEMIMLLPDIAKQAYLTSTKTPTFYFYIPEQPSQVAKLVFRLSDSNPTGGDDRGLIAPVNLPLSKPSGLVKAQVELPAAIEQGKQYKWSFAVYCEGQSDPALTFKGAITHQNLSDKVKLELTQATLPEQKAEIYQRENFLLDEMALLVEEVKLQSKPFDVVLNKLGLDAIN
jgi:hypothetical protein